MQRNAPSWSIDDLRHLRRLVADTSSLILIRDSGYLAAVCKAIELSVPPGVVNELGEDAQDIGPCLTVARDSEAPTTQSPVDDQVLDLALHQGVPVLSDDLDILGSAAERGLPIHTARTLLEILLLQGHIDLKAYQDHRKSLSALVRYALPLYSAAEDLHQEIRKEIG